jgi:hypothetical protein
MKSFLLGGLTLLLAVACSKTPDFDPGETIATVNGQALDEQFYFDSYIDWLSRTGFNDDSTSRVVHLDNAIDVMLLAQEAEKRGLRSADAYLEYMRLMRDAALGGRFLQAAVFDTLGGITEEQLRDAYAKTQRKVYVRQLYFNDETQALTYQKRLAAGEDFLALANELYGTAPGDSSAGYLGDVSYFGTDDAFAEAAFSLGMFDVSPVVRTRQGWVILRVENMNRNLLMTEAGFQNRRGRLHSLILERRVNLAGDTFVRDHMRSLQPMIQQDAYRQLEPYLTGLAPEARLQDAEYQVMSKAVEPGTPLVLYKNGSETGTFTVGDYMRWVPYIPYMEMRTRPGASIGRALRNEVFAREGEEAGFEKDRKVRWQLDYVSTFRLANDLKATIPSDSLLAETLRELRGKADIRIDREVFDRLAPFLALPKGNRQ